MFNRSSRHFPPAAGLLVPDIPLEETPEIRGVAEAAGLELVLLTTPTTPQERMRRIAQSSQGFVYLVSVTGALLFYMLLSSACCCCGGGDGGSGSQSCVYPSRPSLVRHCKGFRGEQSDAMQPGQWLEVGVGGGAVFVHLVSVMGAVLWRYGRY